MVAPQRTAHPVHRHSPQHLPALYHAQCPGGPGPHLDRHAERPALTDRLMIRSFLTLLISLCALGSAAEFHVAVDGSDANSGNIGQPYATVTRALDAVRDWKASHPAEANRIVLHGGTYRLEQSITITPEDSGTADAPLVIEAAQGEIPVLTSGRPITGWRVAGAATPGLQPAAAGHVLE